MGFICEDPNNKKYARDWKPWALTEKKVHKRKDCFYGTAATAAVVGEYVDRSVAQGNVMVFFDSKYNFCLDKDCQEAASCGFEEMPKCECKPYW